ncbi:MAG: HD domain-containing protein [Chloroflexi bacterium]|nr:HD domain-containing protein [Chloroflexota bacterium]
MITIQEARTLYSGGDTAHDFDHVLRVLALAERIAQAEGADMEVVRTAVLLHDVARADEAGTGQCHAALGAARARQILCGHPSEKVEAVAQAIATHRFREGSPPQTLEAQVLYEADKLDAMGAVGVARAYACAGLLGQRIWGEVPAGYAARAPEAGRGDGESAEHTPVHEFRFKLTRLKETLQTPTGRRLAEDRHAFMCAFFDRLEAEVRGQR